MISFLVFLIVTVSFAQNEFQVFPANGETTKGNPNGDGSIKNPWDLKTALSQSSERVNSGDIIWIHQGTYNGRYRSALQSTIPDAFITVSGYEQEKVILNGNVDVKKDMFSMLMAVE
jgi:hypothetical protein